MNYIVENELLNQIKYCYCSLPGLRWSVGDYCRVITCFNTCYQKYYGNYHKPIKDRKMKYVLKALQYLKPFEVLEMIEMYFNMPVKNGHTITRFCSEPIKRELYNLCFEKKKRG